MKIKNQRSCGTAMGVIFACSGAADVGAIADQAARKLARDGVGKMYCFTCINWRVYDIQANTVAAAPAPLASTAMASVLAHLPDSLVSGKGKALVPRTAGT